ncbi:MAG: hypothetical protein ACJ8FY_01495 [Gemmataceae bacterium]
MDQEPSVIREDIEETRQSLTEKIETLENQVMGTVQYARETVEETIDSVKSTVNETVDTVKRTFDVEYQVSRHPFAAAGLAFIGGAAVGAMLKGRARHHHGSMFGGGPLFGSGSSGHTFRGADGGARRTRDWAPATNLSSSSFQGAAEEGVLGRFSEEIEKVKRLAIGTAMGLARDLAKDYLPKTLAPHVEEVLDSATRKLGGQPLEGPVTSTL